VSERGPAIIHRPWFRLFGVRDKLPALAVGSLDLVRNSEFVNVGIDHETAEFAVESIRRWWQNVGKDRYPTSKELLIIADGGGSNGARNRLWKMEVHQFATETGLRSRYFYFSECPMQNRSFYRGGAHQENQEGEVVLATEGAHSGDRD
jgi:hypothetical protein